MHMPFLFMEKLFLEALGSMGYHVFLNFVTGGQQLSSACVSLGCGFFVPSSLWSLSFLPTLTCFISELTWDAVTHFPPGRSNSHLLFDGVLSTALGPSQILNKNSWDE